MIVHVKFSCLGSNLHFWWTNHGLFLIYFWSFRTINQDLNSDRWSRGHVVTLIICPNHKSRHKKKLIFFTCVKAVASFSSFSFFGSVLQCTGKKVSITLWKNKAQMVYFRFEPRVEVWMQWWRHLVTTFSIDEFYGPFQVRWFKIFTSK